MNITGAAVGGAMALFAISLTERILPVVAWMTIEGPSVSQNVISGRVYGYKVRDCIPAANSFIGWAYNGIVWVETPFRFVDDPSPDSARPAFWGRQDFGVWEWSGVPLSTQLVRVSVQHNCNGRLTVTSMAFDPFKEK